jgi:hypothetical protein
VFVVLTEIDGTVQVTVEIVCLVLDFNSKRAFLSLVSCA